MVQSADLERNLDLSLLKNSPFLPRDPIHNSNPPSKAFITPREGLTRSGNSTSDHLSSIEGPKIAEVSGIMVQTLRQLGYRI